MRLIDADALADSLRESKNKLKEILDDERCEMEYRICEGQMITFIEAILRVNETPAIDAVPVVRCKDCVAVSVCNDELVCSRISEVMDGYYRGTVEIVKPDDYCSKGIRRSCAKMDGGAG